MNWLTLLGKIDGALAAAAGAAALYDPPHAPLYAVISGVAGGVGVILNVVSHFLGGSDVVATVKS
jgi:hypothetical protein